MTVLLYFESQCFSPDTSLKCTSGRGSAEIVLHNFGRTYACLIVHVCSSMTFTYKTRQAWPSVFKIKIVLSFSVALIAKIDNDDVQSLNFLVKTYETAV